jgi:hypothetical protein
MFSVALLFVGDAGAKAQFKDEEFVGSESCKRCHKTEYESWKNTYHSKMVRKKDDGILKAVVEKWESDGKNQGPQKGNVTGKEFKLNDVEYVVGSYWKQRFLVKNDTTGNLQFMNQQFNRISGEWEPYGQKNDWDFMCATCHTTGYRLLSYDANNVKEAKSTWIEENIACEACHGPGAKHVKNPKAKDSIWNPSKYSKAEQTRACGYCHIRGENEKFKSPQGNDREDFPAPKLGDSFKPWDDWTKWYTAEAIIPGVHPEDKIDAEYKGDLKGMFILDETSKKSGVYDAGKHHQQYQEFLQSKHFKNDVLSCNDCHSPHAGKKIKAKIAKDTCKSCHGDTYAYEKIMPGTGATVKNLTVRTHTFYKDQSRPSQPTVTGTPVLNKK